MELFHLLLWCYACCAKNAMFNIIVSIFGDVKINEFFFISKFKIINYKRKSF